MCSPDIPEPPDPKETASASNSTNIGTAIANSYLNNFNQKGPDGSLTFEDIGYKHYYDEYTGANHWIPIRQATQTLSPSGQAIQDQNSKTKLNLSTFGANQSGRLDSLLSQPFTLDGLPQAGTPGQYSRFNARPQTDFSADRDKVVDALRQRQQPTFDRQREAMRTQLANSGIGLGSEAYSAANSDFSRSLYDADLAAILAGGQEQSRLAALDQQAWNNDFAINQANNALGSRTFDEQNAARTNALNESFAQRSQPLNELIGLISGTQVQNPQFVNPNTSPIPTTDVAGLINENYNQRVNKEMAQFNAQQGLLGGLFGLGSSFIMSDRRTKTDVKRIGETDDGQPIYTYRYKHDPEKRPQIGLMAQDVEKRDPGAVVEIGGIKHVNVDRALGGLFALEAA